MRGGVESARLHRIVNSETTQFLKTLGQFENLVFVIMSTRENIRLIARSFYLTRCFLNSFNKFNNR